MLVVSTLPRTSHCVSTRASRATSEQWGNHRTVETSHEWSQSGAEAISGKNPYILTPHHTALFLDWTFFFQQYPFTISRGEYRHLVAHLLIAHSEYRDRESPYPPQFLFEAIHITLDYNETRGIHNIVNDIFRISHWVIPPLHHRVVFRSGPREEYLPHEDRFCSTLMHRRENHHHEAFFLHCSNIPNFTFPWSFSQITLPSPCTLQLGLFHIKLLSTASTNSVEPFDCPINKFYTVRSAHSRTRFFYGANQLFCSFLRGDRFHRAYIKQWVSHPTHPIFYVNVERSFLQIGQ